MKLKRTKVRCPPVSDFNINLKIMGSFACTSLRDAKYTDFWTLYYHSYTNNFCKIRKVVYNGGRKQRKLRNRINSRTAYGCIQTDHITAVKSWQRHQHFLQNRPGDCPDSGHSAKSTVFRCLVFPQNNSRTSIKCKLHCTLLEHFKY